MKPILEPEWELLDVGPSDVEFDNPAYTLDADEYLASIGEKAPAPNLTAVPSRAWLVDAADLLSEPDPGPTPFLVEGLMVLQAIVAIVGRWKTTKSYGLLYLLMCIALGEPAWGLPTVAGPVVYVCEESGRAAMWRRLDALCRGYGFDPERLRGRLHIATNARVKLDDPGWQAELVQLGLDVRPVAFGFDPLARMKASSREENSQKDMAPIWEFVRLLRDETASAVCFVHHTGHAGTHGRGTSDLESVWESKLDWKREGEASEVQVTSAHRDAEGTTLRYRIAWDHDTRTMRFPLVEGDLEARIREYLANNPTASANEVFKALGGGRNKTLEIVGKIKAEGGTAGEYHPSTTHSGAAPQGGTPEALYEGSGTTTAEPSLPLVPELGTEDVA